MYRIGKKMSSDKVSIIIPTKNEEKNLPRLLDSIKKYAPEVEIIIVDSKSEDKTRDIIKKRSGVKLVDAKPQATAGKARNIGIKAAKNENIAMLDADTEITLNWLMELKKSMKQFDIVAGYSPDPEKKDMPRVPIYINGQDITYPQCNICYKRKLFKELGYLRKDMKVAEDCEFHYRCSNAGYTIFYNPKMVAYHYERPTKIGWIKKAIKNGYGRYELNNVHPSLKDKHEHSMKSKNIIRLIFGAIGYIKAMVMVEKKR